MCRLEPPTRRTPTSRVPDTSGPRHVPDLPGPLTPTVAAPFLHSTKNPPMNHHRHHQQHQQHRHPRGSAAVALLAAVGVVILFVLFAATCDEALATADDWVRHHPIPRTVLADPP